MFWEQLKNKKPLQIGDLKGFSWSHLGSNQGPPDYESVQLWFLVILNGLKCPFYWGFLYLQYHIEPFGIKKSTLKAR